MKVLDSYGMVSIVRQVDQDNKIRRPFFLHLLLQKIVITNLRQFSYRHMDQ